MSGYGSTGYEDETRQTDEYGNPIHQTGEEYETGENVGVHVTHTGAGEHGTGGKISDGEYGTGGNTTDVPYNTGTGGEYGTGVLDHGTKEHDKDGIFRRSNSSSSSSEDDGQGGRRKKSIVDKIKDKLPGGKKEQAPTIDHDTYGQGNGAPTTPQEGYGHGHEDTNTTDETYGVDGQPEKKSFIEKIKEKLPGNGTPTTPQEGYGHDHEDTNTTYETYGVDGQPEKKSFIEKIKDKLPGGGHN